MFTRKDYLDGNCTHEQYYSQFVNDSVKNIVVSRFGIEKLVSAYNQDENLNNIPLINWDNLPVLSNFNTTMKELGDYLTLSGKVCIYKTAAKMIVSSL